MLRTLLAILALCLCSTAAMSSEIRPVNSWADYRVALKEHGKTDAEADAQIAEALASLNDMDRAAGDDLIGSAALPFRFDHWVNAAPLTLEGLRGSVVLVRWWTDTCPFCASSAPALRSLHADYAERGLALIGVFHPKAGRDDPLDTRRVERAVSRRGFEFPIAIDWNWREGTLKDWWLTGPKRPATSVTFILDKHGVIRFIHPGMEYHDADGSTEHAICADDLARIRAAIEGLLAE